MAWQSKLPGLTSAGERVGKAQDIDYAVVMSSPRSIRLEDRTLERLSSYATRHVGVTGASAAARFVEEGLRMDSHPGIVFRDGPAGRRAVIAGGADVWEVIQAVAATRDSEPTVSRAELMDLVSVNSGVSSRHVRLALDYYGEFADEIDAQIAEAASAETAFRESYARTSTLLGA